MGKRFLLVIVLILLFACSVSKKTVAKRELKVISVGWSDSRHLAYLAKPPNQNTIELHTVELAHNSPKIIADSLISRDILEAYNLIGYCHTMKEVYFPKDNNILKYDILNRQLVDYSMYLPIKTPIEYIFAQPESTMVYAVRSDYREDYMGDFFWWLVWMDLSTGEIIFDTHDCYSYYGFYLSNQEPELYFASIDTVGLRDDTLAYRVERDTRRIGRAKISPTKIRERQRSMWQSPNLEYLAMQGEYGLHIESIY